MSDQTPERSGAHEGPMMAHSREKKGLSEGDIGTTAVDVGAEVGRGSMSDETTTESTALKAREAALIHKVDLAIIPIIMLLYLFSFLDRVNIGNARLFHLEADLGLKGNQYQVCVSILFVTYCIFEVPSNLVLKKFKPGRYISGITIVWGLVATLTGIVQSYGGMIACRLLLGMFEAGLFPGLLTYLTLFYNKKDLALRVGYLFVSAALAGALGGLIAYGIGFMDGVAGLHAWRWILILEGMPSVLTGITCWFILPNSPDTAKFLSAEERALLLKIRQREFGQTSSAQNFHRKDVEEGVRDWHIYVFSFCGFCEDIMLYGFSTFLPTIINGIGHWTSPQANALTIPVYAVGAMAYLIVARISDTQQRRGVYASSFAFVSAIGYALLASNRNAATSYVGCFFVATGLYISVGLPLAWLPGNKPRYGKRAFATGLQLMCGNIAGIVTPFLFPTSDAPKYFKGHGVSLAAVTTSGSIFACMSWYYSRVNKNRAAGEEDWKMEGKTDAEIEEMGDTSPRYVYMT